MDGNLYSIFVDYSVNGGPWTPLAYDAAGVNGGNGFSTTSNNNGVPPSGVAGPAGTTYQFRAQASDRVGAAVPYLSSGWVTTQVYTVPGQPE